MATLRAVKNRIGSVEQIKKIAGALEVVALTRLKRMEQDTIASRSYFDKIRELIFDVTANINFASHKLLERRKTIKSIGLVSVFSDKGLCGNFNANINSRYRKFIKDNQQKKIDAILIGKKGQRYLKKTPKVNVLNIYSALDKEVRDSSILEIAEILIGKFLNSQMDEIYLLYSHFKLHLLGETKIIKLLPLDLDSAAKGSKELHRDYIYEPGPAVLFERLIKEYILNQLQQGIIESRCSEEMSRMLAMKQATDNADKMMDSLNLIYNKTRQSQITRELTEIIAAID